MLLIMYYFSVDLGSTIKSQVKQVCPFAVMTIREYNVSLHFAGKITLNFVFFRSNVST